MSGAIGTEQLLKLPGFIEERRKNAQLFDKLFKSDDRWINQEETGESSWFGFSFIINPETGIERKTVIEHLKAHNIECRPIVTGNFAKNEVLKFFNYEIYGELTNANLLDEQGFFVGNSQKNLTAELEYLKQTLDSL